MTFTTFYISSWLQFSNRIVVAGSISGHVVVNSSRVFLFDQEYGLSQEEVIQECLCVCKKRGEAGIATSYVHRYLSVCIDKSHNL